MQKSAEKHHPFLENDGRDKLGWKYHCKVMIDESAAKEAASGGTRSAWRRISVARLETFT
jgi:glutamine synthetase type III